MHYLVQVGACTTLLRWVLALPCSGGCLHYLAQVGACTTLLRCACTTLPKWLHMHYLFWSRLVQEDYRHDCKNILRVGPESGLFSRAVSGFGQSLPTMYYVPKKCVQEVVTHFI